MHGSIDRREFITAAAALTAAAVLPAPAVAEPKPLARSRTTLELLQTAIERTDRAAGVFDPDRPLMTPAQWCEELRRQVG